jgi:putative oxidoreductase
VLTCIALISHGISSVHGIASVLEARSLTIMVLEVVGATGGILLLIGLWTPVAGTLVGVVKVGTACLGVWSHAGDPWMASIEAVLGAVLAMVGPGAWSLDARLFGRKRIDMPES